MMTALKTAGADAAPPELVLVGSLDPAPAPARLIETGALRACADMAGAVMRSRTRVGRILGAPGTGKSSATHYLSRLDGAAWSRAVRVCCRRGMSEAGLARAVALALGADCRSGAPTDTLLDRAGERAEGVLLIMDEGNHLHWQHMERLRWLSDECGAGLILVGTDLLHRTFADGRNQVYLAQLASRIGTKQVRLDNLDAKSLAAYVIIPRFGACKQAEAKLFHEATNGNWRQAEELADGCDRVMSANGMPFGPAVIQAARQWQAEGK